MGTLISLVTSRGVGLNTGDYTPEHGLGQDGQDCLTLCGLGLGYFLVHEDPTP